MEHQVVEGFLARASVMAITDLLVPGCEHPLACGNGYMEQIGRRAPALLPLPAISFLLTLSVQCMGLCAQSAKKALLTMCLLCIQNLRAANSLNQVRRSGASNTLNLDSNLQAPNLSGCFGRVICAVFGFYG